MEGTEPRVILRVYRVSYGRDNVALQSREYRQSGLSPVGTMEELKVWVKDNSLDVNYIEAWNKTKTEIEQTLDLRECEHWYGFCGATLVGDPDEESAYLTQDSTDMFIDIRFTFCPRCGVKL